MHNLQVNPRNISPPPLKTVPSAHHSATFSATVNEMKAKHATGCPDSRQHSARKYLSSVGPASTGVGEKAGYKQQMVHGNLVLTISRSLVPSAAITFPIQVDRT